MVSKEYRTDMLIKDMEISWLMTHAQRIEEHKLKESARETKRAYTDSVDYHIIDLMVVVIFSFENEGSNGFILYCDASRIGFGFVLMQHNKEIVYTLRQLIVHENNYPTHDLELVAVVFALKRWRHYLYSVHVDVFTDHRSFQYVFKQKGVNLQQMRFLELLKDYDMSILYHLGKANIVVDALSRLLLYSVAHIDYDKEDLIHYMHRLAHLSVYSFDSDDSGVIVQNSSESSFC
ncbi:hypothetical protein MTR67_042934 [Solanum verrucosum]|uniref:Reverse transcriptase RNase H-like domain-containing protein n=1 Tax=Solanum verrucosum TaxID=315347 RepID=A0AAF0ZUM4_SOLVR|nr:hypothetical protein MTR67_042934 [Solanum verrucosum]